MNQGFSVSYSSAQLTGTVTWQCPSNIALVKYWGKRDRQLPSNPSLSFTLSECYTETTIDYEYSETLTSPVIQLTFNGKPNQKFQARIAAYIGERILDLPSISHLKLNIHTRNTFPHSAGIASSASAFGSVALCLCSIEEKINGKFTGSMDFYKKASYLARLGSGSACRSIYGGYTVWGESDFYNEFSNLYASSLPFDVHPEFKDMQDTILVVSPDPKPLSSTEGHALMKGHPYSLGRFGQAQRNLNSLITSLRTGDVDLFTHIVENEALSLHALIMTSGIGTILLKPGSLSIIEKIQHFRNETKLPICFTIDAGPNIHFLYPLQYTSKVAPFIEQELKPLCFEGKIIDDKIGRGPVLVGK